MKQLLDSAKIIILSALLIIGAASLKAWTGPSQAAPNGNTPAPLNIGSTVQTKLGSLIINAATPIQNAIGLTVFGSVTIADGTQGAGKVLTSDDSGNASWQQVGSSSAGILGQACGNGEFVKGFDSTGDIICDFVIPMASITVGTDEQVVIHIKGNAVTLTNRTRNGAALSNVTFADPTNGMPQDGKPLKITGLRSTLPTAKIAASCPTTPFGFPNPLIADKICLYQQPTAANGYETIVWIWDGAAGAHAWKFSLGYAN